MKLLVTGASGLVGAACVRAAARLDWPVVGAVSRWSGSVPGATGLLPADLTLVDSADDLVRTVAPDVIINTAAVADPAACEADPIRSHQLNVELPARLAEFAARSGARLLHLSSEQVFDGEHAPYSTAAVPCPLNLYGRQKTESERRVLAAAPTAVVVRPPLLLGNSLGGRRSTHEKMFESWAAGRPVRLYTDEIRQVCLTDNLAAALLELAVRRDLSGVFHWAGAEPVSRWDLGRRIAAHFHVAEKWLEPMTRAGHPQTTLTRPRDLSLDLAPLDRELRTKPLGLMDAIKELTVPAPFAPWYHNR